MKQERDPKVLQRLQALYLVASGQAHSRSAVASLLDVHRTTIGTWFALYAAGGRTRLLDRYVAPGKASSVPPEALAALREWLEQPEGFASYGEIKTWLAETQGVQMQSAALHKLVAYKLKARPKVVRPRHIKKPEAQAAFVASVAEQIRHHQCPCPGAGAGDQALSRPASSMLMSKLTL